MPSGLRQLTISFEEQGLTHFGGMFLFHRFCKTLGLRRRLQRYVPFPHERINHYQPVDLLLAIL